MKRLATASLALLISAVLVSAEPATQPTSGPTSQSVDPKTATLPAAIEEFVALLEKDDAKGVQKRWSADEKASKEIADLWERMQGAHKTYDYRKWVAKAAEATDKFTIGGHTFGHLHVDWSKTADGWRIGHVWVCR